MLSAPVSGLVQNTMEYENTPLVKPAGFREYDARWIFGSEINLTGIQVVGASLGTLVRKSGKEPRIVVGHDFRAYSLSIKQALTLGLMSAGIDVYDIGLALSPVAYFAQFRLGIESVAMVTASHNENGWTGLKMGISPPLTFGPDEMGYLSRIVYGKEERYEKGGGRYHYIDNMRDQYIEDLAESSSFTKRFNVVVACGNGTAGAFAPEILSRMGHNVISLDTDLDYTFPSYNPNPEDMKMISEMKDCVRKNNADIAFGFDGDGDRCGIVDDEGEVIFSDKTGVLLARDISKSRKESLFIADVKSTGLFRTDPVLRENHARTVYWKTGHSYIKRKCHELNAVAGFEKSGHFFFNPPLGRGYDDGILAAIKILQMLDKQPGIKMSCFRKSLPQTWQSPTMSPCCPDECKYEIVEKISAHYQGIYKNGGKIAGQALKEIVTVNGIRITLTDGTWGLVRASSNKPELVVVVESPVSENNMKSMFYEIDTIISQYPEIGKYNQKI